MKIAFIKNITNALNTNLKVFNQYFGHFFLCMIELTRYRKNHLFKVSLDKNVSSVQRFYEN